MLGNDSANLQNDGLLLSGADLYGLDPIRYDPTSTAAETHFGAVRVCEKWLRIHCELRGAERSCASHCRLISLVRVLKTHH